MVDSEGLVEAHAEVAHAETVTGARACRDHQNAPIEPTRNRWTTSITPVVVAASTTEAAIAIPKFSAPG